jgi:lysyl-tRNA synthetase class 2
MTVATSDNPVTRRHRRIGRISLAPRTEARLLGLLVAMAGIVNLASALTPNLRQRMHILHEGLTPDITGLAHGATAILGVGLLLVGRGLVHRRRLAYLAALGLLGVSAITHVLKGLDVEEAIVVLVVAVVLWRARWLFDSPIPHARWRTLARVIPAVLIIDFAYGLVGLAIRHGEMHPAVTVSLAFREVGARLIGMTGPLHVEGGFGIWFPPTITVLGAASLAAIVLLALAPVAERTVGHHADLERVRRLVDRADGDSLDPFALRHDKQYVFSDDERAAVAYRYVNGVGLASGDPVGAPESFEDAVKRFLALCDDRGWRPAVVGARADRLALYERLGLRSHYLGDEAVIEVGDFGLEGRAMRPVRQAANRTKNFGLTTEVHREGDLDPTLRRALVGISDRHRAGAPERGFSMALDELLSGRDRDCVIVVCRDATGAPIAFQRYVPCKGGRGLSLDAMRRDAIGPNGVNERMIVDAVDWARTHDVDEVSLNFAAFKGLIEEGAELSRVQAAEAWVIKRLNPYFQIESLLNFNAKFHPRWIPRYLVYRAAGDLAAVSIAALSAEAFLPFDRKRAESCPSCVGANDAVEHGAPGVAADDTRTEEPVRAR